MSRIGKKPIPVPTGVNITVEPEVVRVAGPTACQAGKASIMGALKVGRAPPAGS